MRRCRIAPCLVLTAVTTFASSPARAQKDHRVAFTPYVGVYAPSTDVFRLLLVQTGTTVSFSARHQPAAALGASASVWLTDRFAIEAGGLYARSTVRADLLMNQIGTVTSSRVDDDADVWAGSLKLLIQTLPPASGLNLRIGIGPALITRGGPAYRTVDEGKMSGLTDLGASLSLCSRVPLGRFADLRVRVEDLVYQANQTWQSNSIAGAELKSDPKLQHDFVLSVGLQLGVGR
jgi:hypothetical protein